MWTLTVRSPDTHPTEYQLKPGRTTIGRRKSNNIVIPDEAASRAHAELTLDPSTDAVTIQDLGSKNGTYVNRRRIAEKQSFELGPNDVMRIGMFELLLSQEDGQQPKSDSQAEDTGFQPFTRELLLESFDNHAVLLYEVIQQLNSIMDIDIAMKEVGRLLQVTLGADRCRVILEEDFNRISQLGFPATIAKFAIEHSTTILLPSKSGHTDQLLSDSAGQLGISSALCVPVVSNEHIIALIYMIKTDVASRYFSERDMQLAVAVGHLAALTIERLRLMDHAQEEHRIRQLLQRFVAPTEAEFLLRNYLSTGSLPGLTEHNCTVLFADIASSFSLAERLGAKAFGELLNRYYQDVTNIIFEYGGMIDKYLGDGIMAVFGMTGIKDQPEQRAVESAKEIISLLEARYRQKGIDIDIGIGINTGLVVAGYVSTRERVELSVLGDTVNVAAGLEAMARPNRIFIGPNTADAVSGKFQMEDRGEMKIKDRTQPLQVYEILGNLG